MEENKLVIVKDNEIVIDNDFIERYRNFKKVQLEMSLIEKDFKAQLKKIKEDAEAIFRAVDGFSAKIKAGYTTKRFDSTRFKKECPEIYEEYSKDSSVSSSITIDVE
jgi:predicted phage-related endonuclease